LPPVMMPKSEPLGSYRPTEEEKQYFLDRTDESVRLLDERTENLAEFEDKLSSPYTADTLIQSIVDAFDAMPFENIRQTSKSMISDLVHDYGVSYTEARKIAVELGLEDVFDSIIQTMKSVDDMLAMQKANAEDRRADYWAEEAEPSVGEQITYLKAVISWAVSCFMDTSELFLLLMCYNYFSCFYIKQKNSNNDKSC